MDTRFSSPPATRSSPPRPATYRKRSNSLPIVEALGCSTPEAELILAEGKAAIRRRHASERPPRRRKSHHHQEKAYRPQDHMHHLSGNTTVSDEALDTSTIENFRSSSHNRIPSSTSNYTDRSASTIKGSTGAAQPLLPSPPASPTSSPLGDYSANLAKFIQSQLDSIPSYHTHATTNYPHSCPDLTLKQSPPQSPVKQNRRPVDMPNVEIPPMRPPLRSAFSEWSSADDSENQVDQVPPLPSVDPSRNDRNTKSYTPSILNYYENSSFLLSSTPLDSSEYHAVTAGVPRNSLPPTSVPLPRSQTDNQALASSPIEPDLDSSSTRLSRLTSSSVPSFSSTSSYFEYKKPFTIGPHLRNTVIAAVTPPEHKAKVLHAISPFEGAALTKVHSILVESKNRVRVEGMSFDILGDLKMPEESVSRVPTPC